LYSVLSGCPPRVANIFGTTVLAWFTYLQTRLINIKSIKEMEQKDILQNLLLLVPVNRVTSSKHRWMSLNLEGRVNFDEAITSKREARVLEEISCRATTTSWDNKVSGNALAAASGNAAISDVSLRNIINIVIEDDLYPATLKSLESLGAERFGVSVVK
jgi:hypothetical protein